MSDYRDSKNPANVPDSPCLRLVLPGRILWIPFCTSILLGAAPGALSGENGMTKRALPDCPDTPNCVSSLAEGTSHYIAPLHYQGTVEGAKSRLLDVINGFNRTRIVDSTEFYIRVTFTSRLFGFTDDVEFQIDDEKQLIHMRSASRTGYFDLGANRRRCERIRASFNR